ncbi:hypothetical protein K504DRAFT_392080 [Pleomassaria siparia CBS 279.74]|uniref:Uncharacterized protein n=1 Tax=Pleomassaria siparia CBS 279.74 TaxID=1314801 RepID=A0A6G1JTM4_9PLEO|nr:hypothetical protein K504DRAFT_392080 [Pleomassaria siparia CBS 279.74]
MPHVPSRPRNLTFFSIFSLGGGYMMMKSRALETRQKERAAGDYSVSVDRSGT